MNISVFLMTLNLLKICEYMKVHRNIPLKIHFVDPVPGENLYPTKTCSALFYSGCVFSILFPLFIISGNEADPVTGAW